jgi:hypothetical protein
VLTAACLHSQDETTDDMNAVLHDYGTFKTLARSMTYPGIITCCLCLEPPHAELADECNAVLSQFAHALEHEKILEAVDTDTPYFRGVAHASRDLAATWSPEYHQGNLKDRHGALVRNMTAMCTTLRASEDYGALLILGARLKELEALDFTLLSSYWRGEIVEPSASAHYLQIGAEVAQACHVLIKQAESVWTLQAKLKQRDELQARLQVLGAVSKLDFESIGRTGRALEAVTAELARLSLSGEDYLTLADRHATLLLKATALCKELAAVRDHGSLAKVAAELVELKKVDVSALPHS